MKVNKKSILIIGIEIAVLISLYSFINSEYIKILPQCWIYQTIGLLCPACGGTRCVIYLLNLNWIDAFFSHMVFFIGISYLIVTNIVYLINLNREKKIAIWIYPKYGYAIIFAILLIFYTIMRNLL